MPGRHPLLHGVWPPSLSEADGVLDYTRPSDDLPPPESTVRAPGPRFLEEEEPLLVSGEEEGGYPGLAGGSVEVLTHPGEGRAGEGRPGEEGVAGGGYPASPWFRLPVIYLAVLTLSAANTSRELLYKPSSLLQNQTDDYCMLIYTTLWAPVLFVIPAVVYRVGINRDLPLVFLPCRTWGLIAVFGAFSGLTFVTLTLSSAVTSHTASQGGSQRTEPRTPQFIASVLGMAKIPLIILGRFIVFGDRPTWTKLFACGCIFVAYFIAIEPAVFDLINEEPYPIDGTLSQTDRILFPLLYLLSVVFFIMTLAAMEKVVRKNDVGTLSILAWSSLVQIILILGLYWLNVLPKIGLAGSLEKMGSNLRGVFSCQFGISSNCGHQRALSWIYVMTSCATQLFQVVIIRHIREGTFVVLLIVLSIPLTQVLENIFTSVPPDFNSVNVPFDVLGFSIGSFVLIVPCIIIYTRF